MFQGWQVMLHCLKVNEEILIPANEFSQPLDVGAHGGFHISGIDHEKFFRFFVISEGLRIVRLP